jgi:hypothetical protein
MPHEGPLMLSIFPLIWLLAALHVTQGVMILRALPKLDPDFWIHTGRPTALQFVIGRSADANKLLYGTKLRGISNPKLRIRVFLLRVTGLVIVFYFIAVSVLVIFNGPLK